MSHPLVSYTKFFNDNFKNYWLEWLFSERYADDSFFVPDENYMFVFWARMGMLVLTFYLLLSTLIQM